MDDFMTRRRPDPARLVKQVRRAARRRTPPDRPARGRSLVELPPGRLAPLKATGHCESDARAYTFGPCSVIVGTDPGSGHCHLSIAHPKRLPEWGEVVEVRERLMPRKAVVAMILPPRESYVNIHQNCLHLWELPPGPLADSFQRKG